MYTGDNGGTNGWGGYPKNLNSPSVNNEYMPTEPGSTSPYVGLPQVTNKDNLHLVSKPGMNPIYGGHPNPIRADPGGAVYTGEMMQRYSGTLVLIQRQTGLRCQFLWRILKKLIF